MFLVTLEPPHSKIRRSNGTHVFHTFNIFWPTCHVFALGPALCNIAFFTHVFHVFFRLASWTACFTVRSLVVTKKSHFLTVFLSCFAQLFATRHVERRVLLCGGSWPTCAHVLCTHFLYILHILINFWSIFDQLFWSTFVTSIKLLTADQKVQLLTFWPALGVFRTDFGACHTHMAPEAWWRATFSTCLVTLNQPRPNVTAWPKRLKHAHISAFGAHAHSAWFSYFFCFWTLAAAFFWQALINNPKSWHHRRSTFSCARLMRSVRDFIYVHHFQHLFSHTCLALRRLLHNPIFFICSNISSSFLKCVALVWLFSINLLWHRSWLWHFQLNCFAMFLICRWYWIFAHLDFVLFCTLHNRRRFWINEVQAQQWQRF